jgi:acetyl esterase/lipase
LTGKLLVEYNFRTRNWQTKTYFIFQLPPDRNGYKAVMVWFHGGGFGFGSGNTDLFGSDYLMEGDVVFVSVNYRLGPLGKSE